MKSIAGKDLKKAVERNGWALLRVRGSHHIYGKPGSNIRLSILIHGNAALKKGLLNHLLKVAGLTESDL
ncbi:MAG: type II toxin-antitoxin system HicA family toxin [Planctomycetes bacterium]|nr:type II toxin-antitoxin system HicA family toxin [Planctomycetota bacterium]MBU4398739.1 type II toxin-antitoxin system HicA family toxin [Planctomycetota bacterium]MCG2683340.1 type II toxin-antitoxin system HicA family toxin [Planctomycetales bacterium]